MILLPETNLETVLEVSEKLRILSEECQYPYIGQVTASFGVTHFLKGDNEATFINRADKALYMAKENGRNKVEVLPPVRAPLTIIKDVKARPDIKVR